MGRKVRRAIQECLPPWSGSRRRVDDPDERVARRTRRRDIASECPEVGIWPLDKGCRICKDCGFVIISREKVDRPIVPALKYSRPCAETALVAHKSYGSSADSGFQMCRRHACVSPSNGTAGPADCNLSTALICNG